MRMTKKEKKALLATLEWMTEYHDTDCAWLDPDPESDGFCGGYNLQSVRDKLRKEVVLTDDERLERDDTAHCRERDKYEHSCF